MLFGGGAGSVVGGAIGGAAGGALGVGFGLQAVFSAIGAGIDQLALAATELGTSLKDLEGTFESLKEKSLLSSKAEEKRIQAISDLGFEEGANVQARADFRKNFGKLLDTQLTRAASEAEETARSFAALGVELQRIAALAIGPVVGVIGDVADQLANFANTSATGQALEDALKAARGTEREAPIREALKNSQQPLNTHLIQIFPPNKEQTPKRNFEMRATKPRKFSTMSPLLSPPK